MRGRGLFLFTILSIFLSNNVQADETLSLEGALNIAKQNNPQVIIAQKKAKIAKARFKNSKKLKNPVLDIDVEKLAFDLEDEARFDDDLLEGEVRINQPIQTWGKRGLIIKITEDELKQAEYEYQSVWMDVSRQIKERYSEALLHQKEIELTQDNLERSQRLLEQVNIKFNEGKARNHELSRSKLEVANARNEYLEAENSFYISLGTLNLLLGNEMDNELKLEDGLNSEDLNRDFDGLLAIALNQRADVLSQSAEVNKQKNALKLAKRQRLPDVNLGLFVEREEEIYSAGAGLSFELPFWNQFQQEIKEASLDKEIAEVDLEALKKEVELDVYTAFKNAELARKSLMNLQEAIKEANELLRIITIEFQEGEATFLIYLEGLASYKETKRNYLASLANYENKLAVLEQTIGGKLNNREENDDKY